MNSDQHFKYWIQGDSIKIVISPFLGKTYILKTMKLYLEEWNLVSETVCICNWLLIIYIQLSHSYFGFVKCNTDLMIFNLLSISFLSKFSLLQYSVTSSTGTLLDCLTLFIMCGSRDKRKIFSFALKVLKDTQHQVFSWMEQKGIRGPLGCGGYNACE